MRWVSARLEHEAEEERSLSKKRGHGFWRRVATTLCVALIAAGVTACGQKERQPIVPITPTVFRVPWQRAQVPIGAEHPIIRVSGVLRLHQGTVNDLALSESGAWLATAGADGVVAVWNLANGEALFVQTEIDARHVFFGPGDQTLITVSRSGQAQVWSLSLAPPRTLELLTRFSGYRTATAGPVVQSPDRSLLAFGAETGAVTIWRVPEAGQVAHFAAHREAIGFLAFSPDGRYLVSIGLERGVRLWAVPSGELVQTLVDADQFEVDEAATRAAFASDGGLVAVSTDTFIRLWTVPTGESTAAIPIARHMASSQLTFSSDGRLLVGCGSQPVVGLWDVSTGRQLASLALPGQACRNAAFAPDSTLLLTLPAPGRELYLWNLARLFESSERGTALLQRADRRAMGLPDGVQFFDLAWPGDGRFVFVLDETGPVYALTAQVP